MIRPFLQRRWPVAQIISGLLCLQLAALVSCGYSAEDYLEEGRTRLDAGDPEAAIPFIERSIEREPSQEAYNLLGVAFYQKQDFKKSVEVFGQAIELGTANDYRPYYNRGNSLVQLKRYPEAIRDYNMAIRSNPTIADAFLNRGNAKYFTRNFEQAIADYQEALRLDSTNFLSHFNLGKALVANGNFQDAKAPLVQSINLNQGYAPSHYWLGVSETETGNIDEGCLHFKTAERLGDGNARRAVEQLCAEE